MVPSEPIAGDEKTSDPNYYMVAKAHFITSSRLDGLRRRSRPPSPHRSFHPCRLPERN